MAPGALATNMSPDASVNAAGAQPVAASTRASASAGATTNAVGAVYTPAQALSRAQGTRSSSSLAAGVLSSAAVIIPAAWQVPCSSQLRVIRRELVPAMEPVLGRCRKLPLAACRARKSWRGSQS